MDWGTPGGNNFFVTSGDHNMELNESSSDDSSPKNLVIDAGSAGATPTVSSPAMSIAEAHELFLPNPLLPPMGFGGEDAPVISANVNAHEKLVKFVGRTDVVTEGTGKDDVLCLYKYHWGSFSLSLITRNKKEPLIPMRDIYEKVIPDIKRNVLSSRMSKLGIHSYALTEPYVMAMKKLGVVVTARSHYVTIPDFGTLCEYFSQPPPASLRKLVSITSQSTGEDIFKCLYAQESASPTENSALPRGDFKFGPPSSSLALDGGNFQNPGESGAGGMFSRGEFGSSSESKEVADSESKELDIRELALPSGSHVTLLIREGGVPFISNQELIKIIPSVNRGIMETLRKTYSIVVHHANKMEVGYLKNVGILGAKAGRCLLYKMVDVAKMFGYWNLTVPNHVIRTCEGELPPKVETQSLHSTSSHHHYQHHHQPHHHQHQHPPPPPPPSSSSSSSSAISPSPSYQHQHHQISSGAPGAPPHDPLGLGNSVPPLSHLINTHPQQQQQSQPLTSHTHLPHPHPPPPPPPPPPPYPYGTPPPPPQHQQQLSGSHYPGQQQLQWPNNASDIQQQQSSLLGMPPPSSASSHQGLLETPAAMRTPPMLPQSSSLPSGSGSGSSFRTGMGPQQQSQSLQNDLTPEHFQGPIQFLNSLHHQQHQHQHSGSGSGSGGAGTGTGPNYMCPSGTRIDIGNPIAKRRSSTSSVCFDDQNMEYSTLNWANHKITLLCPLNEEPHVAVPEISSKIFHDRTYLTLHRRNLLDIDTVSATSVQILALRARGSLDQFTGKTKLISLSSAVKLASDAGIPIPQNVLDECWKFSKVHQQDPNSTGTIRQPQPQNFSPVPINPSQLQKPSSLHHQHQHQLHHSHSHSHSAVRDELPFQRSGTNIASTTTIPAASSDAVKRGLRSQSDLCSVPVHPDIVDLGPSFRTPDGTICHVRWDKEVFVVFMSSKGGNYVGLYQTYEMVFKQFTTSRMNFKMRMRKYSVRSIRAPSGIRVKMIELNALPPHSPVCGLIKVSEFDVLAKSYGVAIPGVFLDAFSSTVAKQQQQQAGKRLPNNASSSGSSSKNSLSDGGGEVPIRYHDIDSSGVMTLSSNSQSPVKDSLVVSIPLTRFMSVSPMHESLTSGSASSNVPPPSSSSSSSSSFAFSSSSVPRNPGLHRAGPWHKTHPSASAASSNSSSSSSIHQLAKRISRRYVSKGGMQVNRVCPKCHKVNPTGPKKRCMYCEEFLVGRACPSCGTLNHNRTKECFKCQSIIMYPGQGQGQERTHHSSNKAVTWYPPASVPVPTSAPTTGGALEATPPFLASAASPSSSLLLDHHLTHIQVQPFPSPSLPSSLPSSSSLQLRDTLLQQQQQSVAMGNAQNVPHMTHTLYSMSNVEGGAGGSTCTSVIGGGGGVGSRVESATAEDDEGMEDSPFSPHDQFAPPPIRSAALKSMFPEEAQKPEDGAQLITKTVYSGSVSSTRQCRECGQLNSKMAKKCVQCRSPLQGRPCPQCSRPNHNHSTECYKCGTPLPPTATKWVYSGGRGNRVNQESGPIMQLAVGRAPISCIRCRRLKQHRRLKCGRCGDLFHTKPFFPLDVGGSSGGSTAAEEGLAEGGGGGGGGAMGAEGGRGGTKRRKGLGVELSPSFDDESDASLPASSLMRFARNIVQLGIDEGLVPLITEVESKCREKVYDAEEEYETLEEQYQEFLKGKCGHENSFHNAQAELDGMMVELESYQREQTHWKEKEAEAREVLVAIPDQRIQELQSKISSARQLLEL